LSLARQESGDSTWELVNDSEWGTNSANGSISSLIAWSVLRRPGTLATVSIYCEFHSPRKTSSTASSPQPQRRFTPGPCNQDPNGAAYWSLVAQAPGQKAAFVPDSSEPRRVDTKPLTIGTPSPARGTRQGIGLRGFRRRFAQQFQDEWKPRPTPTFHHPTVLLLSCSHRASRPVASREQWSS